MPARILILGGYGNFGSIVARRLAGDANVRLLIGGRSRAKAEAFVATLAAVHPAEPLAIDIAGDVEAALRAARPDLVIHTVGPFQGQSYRVAEACIAVGAHYVDLADGRDFMAGIGALDERARAAGVAVIAGASSVPALTAAIVDRYRGRFARLDSVDAGISTAEQGIRGLATAASVLSYVGKPFRLWRGGGRARTHGWQGLRAVRYPELGRRLFGDVDVADLDLFPPRYPGLAGVRFGAGHEVAILHLGLWALSWPVRLGLLPRLSRIAPLLLSAAHLFSWLGTGRSGLHMVLAGTGHDGAPKSLRFFLIARSGHGPHVPCIPAILLARRIAAGEALAPGARPCLDLIDLDQYLAGLDGLDIDTLVEERGA